MIEYERKLETQGGKCQICGGINYKGIALAVDHHHSTGSIRGLLCNRCNTVIGLLEESLELIHKLGEYMKRYDANVVEDQSKNSGAGNNNHV